MHLNLLDKGFCPSCCSVTQSVNFQLFATPWTAALQTSLSFTTYWNLLKLMSIELVMPSNHLILCCPLLLLPQSFPASLGLGLGLGLGLWSFAVSQLFPLGGQSNGVSASHLVCPIGADVIQDPKEIPEAFTFFPPKYCSDCQINLIINSLSGHCHVVCMMSTYFLDKCSLICLNQDISQLCISV